MTEVAMLDHEGAVLHRPSTYAHMVSACGISLNIATVGPRDVVEPRAESMCVRCFR